MAEPAQAHGRPTARPTVETRAVDRRYDSIAGPVVALFGIDLLAERGQLTVIAGESGSGKSTLLAIVACIDRADSGMVLIGDVDVQQLSRPKRRNFRRRSLGLVLPAPADNLLHSLDAAGNLAWSARRRNGTHLDAEARETQLTLVGLEGSSNKRTGQLSSGEQQRLALLCALVGDPSLVLADEPTASLDAAASDRVTEVLRAAADAGATLMVSTHDERVIEAADAVIRLDHGRRIE
ncbi:MAG: ATP-binding cassette domain-containing protein [Ilumatobacteraceae bacterium]